MSKIENQVIAKIESRAATGKAKYGTTMERKDLTFRQWVQHLQEELLDAAIYAEKLLDETAIPTEREPEENGFISKQKPPIPETIFLGPGAAKWLNPDNPDGYYNEKEPEKNY